MTEPPTSSDTLENTACISTRARPPTSRCPLPTYLVVVINFGYPPSSICTFRADALPRKFPPRIIHIPPAVFRFLRGWFKAESIELLYPPQLTGEGSDALVYVGRLFFALEMKGDIAEVSASKVDCRRAE